MTAVARNCPRVPDQCVPLKGNCRCRGKGGPSLQGCVRPPACLLWLMGFVSAAQDAPKPDQRLRYDRTQGFLPPPGLCLHAQQLAATQVCWHTPPSTPQRGMHCGLNALVAPLIALCSPGAISPQPAGAAAAALPSLEGAGIRRKAGDNAAHLLPLLPLPSYTELPSRHEERGEP